MKRFLRKAYAAIPFKQPVFELLRKHVDLPMCIYQHLHFRGVFKVRIDEQSSFRLHSYGDIVENELFWSGFNGVWEAKSLQAWRMLVGTVKGSILDVGANTGVYSIAAAALNPSAQIIAFEPVTRIADRLEANAELNGRAIRIVRAAVSDRTGIATIYDSTEANNYTASLEPAYNPAATQQYDVPILRLDDFLAKNGDISTVELIKLDIETHEAAALAGMQQLLRRNLPAIIVEILDEAVANAVQQQIERLNFRIFGIDETHGLRPLQQLQPMGDQNWNNLLCTAERFCSAGLARLLDVRAH